MANYFSDAQVVEIAEQAKLWCSESNTVFSEETRNHLLGLYKELMNLAVSTAIHEVGKTSYMHGTGEGFTFGAFKAKDVPNNTTLYTVKEIS